MSSICIYILGFANVILLFKYILGFKIRKSRMLVTIAILGFTVGVFLKIIFLKSDNWLIFGLLTPGISLIFPIMLFQGQTMVLLLISINLEVISTCICSLIIGVISLCGYDAMVEFCHFNIVAWNRIICFCILLSIAFGVRKNIGQIRSGMEDISKMVLVAIFVVLSMLNYRTGYVGMPDAHTIISIVSKAQILTGLLAIACVCCTCMLEILFVQQKKLRHMAVLNEQCIKEQMAQYNILIDNNNKLREFRHDYRAHLAAMSSYINNKEYEGLSKYLCQLNGKRPMTGRIAA